MIRRLADELLNPRTHFLLVFVAALLYGERLSRASHALFGIHCHECAQQLH